MSAIFAQTIYGILIELAINKASSVTIANVHVSLSFMPVFLNITHLHIPKIYQITGISAQVF